MNKDLSWDTDPIVLLEGEILPVLSAAPELLGRLAMPFGDPADDDASAVLLPSFARAEAHLRDGGATYLEKASIRLAGDDLQICIAAADTVTAMHETLGRAGRRRTEGNALPDGEVRQIMDRIAQEMRPAVEHALNVFRRVFITAVLERQKLQARQAESAIRKLNEISDTIFFIAVNASVEAARAGDAGKGFAVIGQDIRSLSLSARAATEDLCALMESA